MDGWMDKDQRSRIPCASPALSVSASACAVRRIQVTGWLALCRGVTGLIKYHGHSCVVVHKYKDP